jgi:uncharacterized protein YndB with AHSA1/START domain
MAIPEVRPDTTLRLERTIAAPREKVFAAWTQAEAVARWFAPGAAYKCAVPALEARPGGVYRIEMAHSGGNVHFVGGVYREVVAPSRLVFTWGWEKNPERGQTLVTVELFEQGAGTRLVLTHELFPSIEVRDSHKAGWNGGLDQIVKMFETQS